MLALAEPVFPPLLEGRIAPGDPFAAARAAAAEGCDAGLVLYDVTPDRLRAAVVFAPEVPLAEAMVMLPVCGVGFQNALGVLAPPEVGVHLDWDGGIRVNGARCGHLAAAAAPHDPDAVPDWLVVGLDLVLRLGADEPGRTPERTGLWEEGCAEVDPVALLESWTRHMLVWLNRWTDDGTRPLYQEWKGLAHGLEGEVTVLGRQGTFLGVDDRFGMLLRGADGATTLLPLTALLKES